MPETTIGLSPDVGGTYLLARAPEQLGLHAGTTGIHFSASDGIHLGLADTYVPSDSLEDLTHALTTEPVDQVLPHYTQDIEASALAEAEWINQAYSHHNVTDVLAALDELADTVPAAGETAELLRSKSPTMVKVAFEAIRRARELSLEEALTQEYAITMNALRSHDFREGVRAQLIDKDRAPQWNPAGLDGVSEELVCRYFAEAPGNVLSLR